MSIRFVFDLQKTIAALAFLAEREKGNLNMFLSIKMLYLADKKALASWGKTITGDKMVSMPKGPVLSTVYDLFKGVGTAQNLKEWNFYFGETVNNAIQVRQHPDIELLSEDERAALDAAREEIESVAPWEVAKWLHESCPEWEDPHGSSRSIDPAVILRNAGHSEDEIKMIEDSADTFKQLDKVFCGLAGH